MSIKEQKQRQIWRKKETDRKEKEAAGAT